MADLLFQTYAASDAGDGQYDELDYGEFVWHVRRSASDDFEWAQ